MRIATALASVLVATGSASAAELDALLAALAQPTPTETVFVERRESALLDQPLRLSGRLMRPQPGTLVREVEQPFRERTTIAGERVRIERDGERARSFSLRRAPELAAVLASFQALLDGERAALDPLYTIAYAHDADGWRLRLEPKQPRLARRLGRVELHGVGDELACIATRGGEGADSLMLVGRAAASGDFAAHCGGSEPASADAADR